LLIQESQEDNGHRSEFAVRLSRGDLEPFWEFWEQNQDYYFRICLRKMGGNHEDAKDALSDVTVKAAELLPRHANRINNLKSWLAKVTVNACVDALRQKKTEVSEKCLFEGDTENSEEDGLVAKETPDAHLMMKEGVAQASEALKELTPALREAFVLRTFKKMSYDQMADYLNVTPDAARKRIQRARATLLANSPDNTWDDSFEELIAAPPSPDALSANQDAEDLPLSAEALHAVAIHIGGGVWADAFLPLAERPTRVHMRLAALRKYVARHDNGWKKRLELALLLFALGRWTESIDECQAVLARRGQVYEARLLLGIQLLWLGRKGEAAEALRQAPVLAKDQAAGRHAQAWRRLSLGQTAHALRAFSAAARIGADNPVHACLRGWLLLTCGRPERAWRVFAEAMKRFPNNAILIAYCSEALMQLDRPAEASALANRALSLDPQNPLALLGQIEARCRAGLVRGQEGLETRRMIREAVKLAPDQARVQAAYAAYYAARGQNRKGIDRLRRFLEERPGHRDGWRALAYWLWRAGEAEAAKEAGLRGKLLGLDRFEDDALLCDILAAAKDRVGLGAALQDLLIRYDEDWRAWILAGRLGARFLQYNERACGWAERSVRLQPKRAAAWFGYGEVLRHAGRHDQARTALIKGFRLYGGEPGALRAVRAAIGLAVCCQALGRDADRLHWARDASARAREALKTDLAEGWHCLGLATIQLGCMAEARQAVGRALNHNLVFPEKQEARKILNELRPTETLPFPILDQ